MSTPKKLNEEEAARLGRLLEFSDELGMDEELHPDLQACLFEMETFGTCIKHPLVFAVPYFGDAGRMNRMLEMKRKATDESFEQGKYSTFLWMHERPHRLEAFLEVEDLLTDPQYWELLENVWVDTENAWQHVDEWFELWQSSRERPADLGDSLPPGPDRLIIYRGVRDLSHRGISWTLSYKKAQWFAGRLLTGDEVGYVLSAYVERNEIWYYTDQRNEQEVLADVLNFNVAAEVPHRQETDHE